jgi:hypothetical protein
MWLPMTNKDANNEVATSAAKFDRIRRAHQSEPNTPKTSIMMLE